MGMINTKYFADINTGLYLGSFSSLENEDGTIYAPTYPDNAIEVPEPPAHATSMWDGQKWVEDQSVLMSIIRDKRDDLLRQSDYTQLSDSPLSADKKSEWANYRQALREVPQNFGHPDDVIWPEKPA